MTGDPYYNPACDLFLGLDKGYHGPNVTLWIQPDAKGERVMVLYAHYQWLRTTDENARIALDIHKKRGYGPLTGGWGDPSAPDMLRSYSQVLGVNIAAPRIRSVAQGQEIIKVWLARWFLAPKGHIGLGFSRECGQVFYAPADKDKRNPFSLIIEMDGYLKHEPGKGKHHAPDALRYFFSGWEGA